MIIHTDEVIVIEAKDKRQFNRDDDVAGEMDHRKRHDDDVFGAEDRNRKRFFPW